MLDNYFNIHNLNKKQFLDKFSQTGFCVVENVYDNDFLDLVNLELHEAITIERSKFSNEPNFRHGMLLACPIYGGKLLEVLENEKYFEPAEWILGNTCIIWVYTSSCVPPNQINHASRIHVDRPYFINNYNEGVGTLILLDDFTNENGATYFLSGSHIDEQQPDTDFFYKNATRLIASKGSVVYFNLRLWHAGGRNLTDKWRNALGIGIIRPFYKQRIDLPKAMQHINIDKLSEKTLQKLGYYSIPPSSIEEYYKNSKILEYKQPSEWKENQVNDLDS